jgi:hypothetical protein
MDQKLSQKQLEQIVAGVQQLSLRQEAELDRDQVREILRELNLPPELLEEAMVQLSRREAFDLPRPKLYPVRRLQKISEVALGKTFVILAGTSVHNTGRVNREKAMPKAKPTNT